MNGSGPYRALLGLMVLAGLVLVWAGCRGAPVAAPGAPRADVPHLVAPHEANSPSYNKSCLSCHGDIMTRTTLNPRFKEAHAAMVPFAPGYDAKVGVTNETCLSCHARVDIVQHSGMLIRKNADMSSCAVCHGK